MEIEYFTNQNYDKDTIEAKYTWFTRNSNSYGNRLYSTNEKGEATAISIVPIFILMLFGKLKLGEMVYEARNWLVNYGEKMKLNPS